MHITIRDKVAPGYPNVGKRTALIVLFMISQLDLTLPSEGLRPGLVSSG